MRVPQLVRRESAPNPGACGDPAELTAHRRGRPRSPASGAVDNAEQGSHRQLGSHGQSWPKLFPAPPVHPYLAPSAALALAHLHRTTPLVEVILAQRERFLNAQPRAPEHHDHRTQPPSVAIGDRVAHYRDDLIDGGRVRRVAHPLVARRGGQRGSRAGSPASGAGPPHRARTWWSWDLLGSDSGYGRCPTPAPTAALPLAAADRASARAQAAASRRPSLGRGGSERNGRDDLCSCYLSRQRQGESIGV